MQPFYNEQQQMLAATVREFAENDLAPLADDVDTNEEFPKAAVRGTGGNGPDWIADFAGAWRSGYGLSRLHGGSGRDRGGLREYQHCAYHTYFAGLRDD